MPEGYSSSLCGMRIYRMEWRLGNALVWPVIASVGVGHLELHPGVDQQSWPLRNDRSSVGESTCIFRVAPLSFGRH